MRKTMLIFFTAIFACMPLGLGFAEEKPDEVAQIDKLLDKLRKITEDNARMKEQITALEKETAAIESSEAGLKQPVQDSPLNDEREAVILRNKVKELEAIKAELQEKNKDIAERLNAEKTDCGEQVNRLRESLNDSEAKNKQLQKNLADSLSSLSGAEKKSASLKRETADMHYNLGVILQDANKIDAAVIEYKKVLESRPDDAETHYNLALIYDTIKNQRDLALEHYRRYLQIKPDAQDAAAVKEAITEIETKKGIWGEPRRRNIGERAGRF